MLKQDPDSWQLLSTMKSYIHLPNLTEILAKAGSILAPSAVSASNFRQGLKVTFRGGLFPDFRKRTYDGLRSAGKNDAEIRASAGRTNFPLNVIGAQSSVGGAILLGQSNCGCSQ